MWVNLSELGYTNNDNNTLLNNDRGRSWKRWDVICFCQCLVREGPLFLQTLPRYFCWDEGNERKVTSLEQAEETKLKASYPYEIKVWAWNKLFFSFFSSLFFTYRKPSSFWTRHFFWGGGSYLTPWITPFLSPKIVVGGNLEYSHWQIINCRKHG